MSKLTFPILQHLADGRFHSGEDLARHFKVSRATIYKAITDAKYLGITIFSVRGRGYKLSEPVALLDEQAVIKALGDQAPWFDVKVLGRVESTNTYLMQAAQQQAPHMTCVAAQMQTAGKGRRGRTWVSQLGASLTFSLLWRFQVGAAALSGLSLAVGVAMMRALHDLGIQSASLKWPNDVLVGDQKLAGILIELQGDMEGESAAIIGIGINYQLPAEMQAAIDQAAIGISQLKQKPFTKSELLGHLLKHLADVLNTFESQGFASLREEWLSYHAYHQQAVRMLMPDGTTIQGTVRDVAADGVLMVETAAGLQRLSAGEISIRRQHELAD